MIYIFIKISLRYSAGLDCGLGAGLCLAPAPPPGRSEALFTPPFVGGINFATLKNAFIQPAGCFENKLVFKITQA